MSRTAFEQFRRESAGLSIPLMPRGAKRQRALVVSIAVAHGLPVELGLVKGFEMAGYEPVVLTRRDPELLRYYRLAGVRKVICWDEVYLPEPPLDPEAVMAGIHGLEALLDYTFEGVRSGRFAASTTLRSLRVGALDLSEADTRSVVRRQLSASLSYARAARAVLDRVRPAVALFSDRGYTPEGELFDMCINRGVDAFTWNAAHRSNRLIMKRYTAANRDQHPSSLSDDTWRRVLGMPWTDAHQQRLRTELYTSYASGDWYSEVGTQFNKRLLSREEVLGRIGVDPSKRTAVIFPHIFWDGSFFFGSDLFGSYERWFVETVRAACANPKVNWVIKVHPANLVKIARDGHGGELAEMAALRKVVGDLPTHVYVLPAESEISTWSLFDVMDYCLTVRGTVGIEAASFGIPVLTAGTGRYDRRGFTVDSDTREAYLEKLAHIHEIPPLSSEERERAQRFAYGVFVLLPLRLQTVTLEYQQDAKATLVTRISARTREDWLAAPDLGAIARWVRERDGFDLIAPDAGDSVLAEEDLTAGRTRAVVVS